MKGITQMNKSTIDMAREACPYTRVELRGAFYDGFVQAAALVRADEREIVEDLLKEYDMVNSAFAKDFRARGKT
jgi:hypothetical protein